MITMMHWGDRHLSDAGPPVLIRHKGCDGLADDRGVCERCGERLDARDAYTEFGPGAAARERQAAAA